MSGPGRFTTAINEMGLTTPLSVAAAGFAGAGVPVFPCAPGGKHPITEHGFHEATTNLAQVRQWWRRFPKANIGVPTGRPSGVVVVDVDVHGVNGFAACCRAKEAGLLSGWEVVVRSPSGGLHAYYPAHESAEQRSWQAGRAGIDFRGDGGYIIAPPSRRAVNGELPHDEAGQGSNVTGYVDSIDHYGNTRQRVEQLISTWNQGSGGAAEFIGEPDDPLIDTSAEPRRRTRTPLTGEEVDAMRTARANGVSVNILAKQFGVHRSTVWAKTRQP